MPSARHAWWKLLVTSQLVRAQAVRLRTSLNEVTAKHKSDTEWYQPRIRAVRRACNACVRAIFLRSRGAIACHQLEANVKEATTTIQTVQMDVELLASMYKVRQRRPMQSRRMEP